MVPPPKPCGAPKPSCSSLLPPRSPLPAPRSPGSGRPQGCSCVLERGPSCPQRAQTDPPRLPGPRALMVLPPKPCGAPKPSCSSLLSPRSPLPAPRSPLPAPRGAGGRRGAPACWNAAPLPSGPRLTVAECLLGCFVPRVGGARVSDVVWMFWLSWSRILDIAIECHS